MDNNNTNFRRFFGASLTFLGVVVVLFALVAFLTDEGKPTLGMHISKGEAAAPFIVGMIFLITGVNLIRES